MTKKSLIIQAIIIFLIIIALPGAHATDYSISIRDITITPDDPSIGDTLKIKVQYRTEGPSDSDINLYLYVDDILEKKYSRSYNNAGTHDYTFYFDTDDLEDRRHEIKIRAKIYDDNNLEDTDTQTETIYLDEDTDDRLYSIDIQDITINPDIAHVEDTIRITTKFQIESPETSKVKLYLYIDGKQEKIYTGNYNRGTRYYTFSYSTRDLEKGIRTAKIKTELYRDTWLKDSDTESQSFHLDEKRGIIHDLDITAINYNAPIDPQENIPVTVTVKNNGNIDEENVKIKLILDDKTVYSTPFYLIRDRTATKTIHIDTPQKSGKHELIIIAYNDKTQQKSIQLIETQGYTLSLELSPKEEAYTRDWIKISGYARQDGRETTKKINIYSDDIYQKTIIPKENGEYTDYIRYETAQYHKITAELGDIRKDKTILIRQKDPAPEEPGKDSTISMEIEKDQPYTIIIVKEGTERIFIEKDNNPKDTANDNKDTTDSTDATTGKIEDIEKELKTINENIEDNNQRTDNSFKDIIKTISDLNKELASKDDTHENKDTEDTYGYVDVETSNKEVVVNNYGSNIVSITITNNLGRKDIFSIDTDFNSNWIFLPESEEIEDNQKKTFHIYFNPVDAKGEYKGQITVYRQKEPIKEIPLTLYVTEEHKDTKARDQNEFLGPKTTTGVIFLIALFLIVITLLHYRKTQYRHEEKRPLEPKIIPDLIGHAKKDIPRTTKEKPTKNNRIFSSIAKHTRKRIPTPKRKYTGQEVYHVNWDHVIM